MSVTWHRRSSWGGSDSAGQRCERGEPLSESEQRWDTPRQAAERVSAGRQDGPTAKGFATARLRKATGLKSHLFAAAVFGVTPLKQDSLTLPATAHPAPGLQQNVAFLRAQNSAKEGVPVASSLRVRLLLSSPCPHLRMQEPRHFLFTR